MNKSVVITGSTRGIGFALAEEFLHRGCLVTVSGRSAEGVEEAVGKLSAKYDPQLIFGFPCDVTDFLQVQDLWESAKRHFARIDIWINNAGVAAPMMDLWELPIEKYQEVIQTNVIGTLYGSKVALSGLLAQGFGALYNMEGYGARGNRMRGVALYGSTKACVHFIDSCLAQETAGTPVITGALAPGMVITEMVTRQFIGREQELENSKRILNIIAERAETVAPVLVEKILNNKKNGVTIAFSSPLKMMGKFIKAPFNKRDLFTS